MSRIRELDTSELTESQLEIYDRIVASRGSISGPFRIWLHSPSFADRAQALGEFLRYRTSLEPRLSELAILVTARHWNCQVEWSLHEPFARKAGLAGDVIDAIRERRGPDLERPDERAVYDYADALSRNRSVDGPTFEAASEQLGKMGVVELTGLVGYYTMVAMTLNAFQVPLPDGTEATLPDVPTFG